MRCSDSLSIVFVTCSILTKDTERERAWGGVQSISTSSGKGKTLTRRCTATAECEHYEHPTRMLVLGTKYQASCTRCGSVGPVVSQGDLGPRNEPFVRSSTGG
jgi:hypothetical protein